MVTQVFIPERNEQEIWIIQLYKTLIAFTFVLLYHSSQQKNIMKYHYVVVTLYDEFYGSCVDYQIEQD